MQERRHLRAAVGRSGSLGSRRRRTLGDAGVGDGGDVGAANGIIDRYADLQVGIADVSLVVIAARFQTTQPADLRRAALPPDSSPLKRPGLRVAAYGQLTAIVSMPRPACARFTIATR